MSSNTFNKLLIFLTVILSGFAANEHDIARTIHLIGTAGIIAYLGRARFGA